MSQGIALLTDTIFGVNKPKEIDISVTRESLGTHLEVFGKKFFRYVE